LASLPIDSSADLGGPHPGVTRAAIVLHGKARNVEGYYRALERAADAAGAEGRQTLLIAPQFLREEDVEAHHLPKSFLRWHRGAWNAGEAALGPAPISSFDVIGGLLTLLGDRTRYPQLRSIVLFGHSGGAQLLNRYAIVAKEPPILSAAGIRLRYVIANPSSYFYFNDERPLADGRFAPFSRSACPEFDHWRYGPIDPPDYVADGSSAAWTAREQQYDAADVIYLLGAVRPRRLRGRQRRRLSTQSAREFR
jgi:hypothetical protein